jgi:hypothetical protein
MPLIWFCRPGFPAPEGFRCGFALQVLCLGGLDGQRSLRGWVGWSFCPLARPQAGRDFMISTFGLALETGSIWDSKLALKGCGLRIIEVYSHGNGPLYLVPNFLM